MWNAVTIGNVARLPTVLVAGGGNLYVELLDAFPPTLCSLVYVDSAEEAQDQAADASLVVIEAGIKGGGMDLCRRLRSDKVTGHIPLILRVTSKQDHVQALSDARILSSDMKGLIKAMRQLCPELAGPPPESLSEEDGLAQDEGWFDDGEQTVLYRRPEGDAAAAGQWPPPPPERRVGQEMGDFALNYSGYVNSLLEALEDPGKLGAAEQARLSEMSAATLVDGERRLAEIQAAVMEALVGKDLDRMKLLSGAKNAIFDKLQRMKPLLGKLDATRAVSPSSPALPGSPSSPNLKGPPAKKSELTLAAEAKAAETKAQEAKAKKDEARQKKPAGKTPPPQRAAYRAGSGALRGESERGTPAWLVVLLVVVLLGGGGTIWWLLRSGSGATAQVSNSAPIMKSVNLESTPAGFVVRALAEDPENDPITFVIRWYVDNQLVESERSVRLRTDLYQPGQQIQVEVTPSDGTSSGAPMRSAIVPAPTSGTPGPGPAPVPGPGPAPGPGAAPGPAPFPAPPAPGTAPAPAPGAPAPAPGAPAPAPGAPAPAPAPGAPAPAPAP